MLRLLISQSQTSSHRRQRYTAREVNIVHDVIVVGIPLLAILSVILFSRNDIHQLRSELRGEINSLRSELRGEMSNLRSEMYARFDKVDQQLDGINADLRQFYHLTGKLEADVENLKKRL